MTPGDHQTRFDLLAPFSPHAFTRPSATAASRNKVNTYELGQHFRTFQTLPKLDEKLVLQRLIQDYQSNESNFHHKYEEEVKKHD